MRTRTLALLLVALAAVAAGCGDRSLMLSVDIASYIDPAVKDVSFGSEVSN